jgi:hypothetical protein
MPEFDKHSVSPIPTYERHWSPAPLLCLWFMENQGQ